MYVRFSFVFLMLLGFWANAEAKPAPDAKTDAHAIEEHYRRAGSLKAIFLESYKQGGKTTQVESGTVYFSKPDRMRWDYQSPQKKLFLVDGSNVWFYVPSDHTASRAKMNESSDWRTPFALLTGKMNLTRLCGHVELADPSKLSDFDLVHPGDQVLRCLPREGEQAGQVGQGGFEEVLLEFDSQYRLDKVVVREPGEAETDFQFGDWEEGIEVPESLFHFEPPPGVAIVDEQALTGQLH